MLIIEIYNNSTHRKKLIYCAALDFLCAGNVVSKFLEWFPAMNSDWLFYIADL